MKFRLSLLIPPETISSDAANGLVTAVDAWGPSMYLGTSNGRILHYFQPSPADQCIIASVQQTHKKKVRPVSRIVLLPSISRALILSHKTTSVFSLPEFAPCNTVASMRNVSDVFASNSNSTARGVVEVTALLKDYIYVVKVEPDKLSLGKKVPYTGALTGARQSSLVLVATSSSYDLIDMENPQRIPLFAFGTPSMTSTEPAPEQQPSSDAESMSQRDDESVLSNTSGKSKEEPPQSSSSTAQPLPIILPVAANEFLVTTLSGETAIGLVVNLDGELSRGTIAWDAYPSSVAVDDPYVFSVVGNSLLIHSLESQDLVQTIEFEEKPYVTRLMSDRTFIADDVAKKLELVCVVGPDAETAEPRMSETLEDGSLTRSRIVVYTENGGIQCLCGQSEFHRLETAFVDDPETVLEQLDESKALQGGPLDVYFSTRAAVQLLKSNTFIDALSFWLRPAIDPRLLVYLLDEAAADVGNDLRVPADLKDLVDQLRQKLAFKPKVSGEPLPELYSSYLQICLQQASENKGDGEKTKIRQILQVAYLRLAIAVGLSTTRVDEIVQQYADDEMLPLITKELQESGRLESLATVLKRQGRTQELLECWKSIITADAKSPSGVHAIEAMSEYLTTVSEKGVLWTYGLWLVSVDISTLRIFTDSSNQQQARFEPSEVLAGLKSLSWDEPWKAYLKYLVFDKKDALFAGDLAFCLLDDLISKIQTEKSNVEKSYTDYMELPAPKLDYMDFFGKSKNIDKTLRRQRVEFFQFLGRDTNLTPADASQLVNAIQTSSVDELLKYETAVLAGIQGNYANCLEILFGMTDYSAAVKQCTKVSSDSDFKPFVFLLEKFMTIPNETDRLGCTKLLLDQWGSNIDILSVLKHAPDSWPLAVLEPYLSRFFRKLLADERASRMKRTLSRAQVSLVSKELRNLDAYH